MPPQSTCFLLPKTSNLNFQQNSDQNAVKPFFGLHLNFWPNFLLVALYHFEIASSIEISLKNGLVNTGKRLPVFLFPPIQVGKNCFSLKHPSDSVNTDSGVIIRIDVSVSNDFQVIR